MEIVFYFIHYYKSRSTIIVFFLISDNVELE